MQLIKYFVFFVITIISVLIFFQLTQFPTLIVGYILCKSYHGILCNELGPKLELIFLIFALILSLTSSWMVYRLLFKRKFSLYLLMIMTITIIFSYIYVTQTYFDGNISESFQNDPNPYITGYKSTMTPINNVSYQTFTGEYSPINNSSFSLLTSDGVIIFKIQPETIFLNGSYKPITNNLKSKNQINVYVKQIGPHSTEAPLAIYIQNISI